MDPRYDRSHDPQGLRPRRRRAIRHESEHRRRQEKGVTLRPQLTSKGLWEFAVLAHEIKQPLTAILSNAQAAWRLLALDPPEVHEVRATLADIITDARRTDEVLRQLQAFVTTGAQELTCLNINDIVQETVGLMARDATAQGVAMTMALAGDLPLVFGDSLQLRQVLLNLVCNALEAMYSVEDEAALVVRTSSTPPGTITVEVQDCGIGAAETPLENLFRPFFTTKAGGMGLGLALSRSIIAAHRGRIWARRNPGRGLTMSFTLPVV
jgi:signal transduction histidine kinase